MPVRLYSTTVGNILNSSLSSANSDDVVTWYYQLSFLFGFSSLPILTTDVWERIFIPSSEKTLVSLLCISSSRIKACSSKWLTAYVYCIFLTSLFQFLIPCQDWVIYKLYGPFPSRLSILVIPPSLIYLFFCHLTWKIQYLQVWDELHPFLIASVSSCLI